MQLPLPFHATEISIMNCMAHRLQVMSGQKERPSSTGRAGAGDCVWQVSGGQNTLQQLDMASVPEPIL